MEMLREIDEETVDFIPNYDGRVQEPTVLPSRFPNLLANGSGGIAVGMATNIPPHNLRELADAVFWALDNHDADEEATLAALHGADQGPRLPDLRTDRRLPGHPGRLHHRAAARSGCAVWWRSRKTPRAARPWSSRSCRTRSTTTTSSPRSPNRSATAGSAGISNIEDQGSDRVGMRIVVEIKRDAVAKVVLNNLYKHTQLQTSFGVNMLSIVDGVPRTLRLDQIIRHYVDHQLEVIVRRTTLPAAQGQRTGPHPARSGQGARRARRGHRVDPGVARPSTSPARA